MDITERDLHAMVSLFNIKNNLKCFYARKSTLVKDFYCSITPVHFNIFVSELSPDSEMQMRFTRIRTLIYTNWKVVNFGSNIELRSKCQIWKIQ